MRNLFRRGISVIVLLAGLGQAQAQNILPQVQQNATRLDAGTLVAVGTNWNTVNTVSTATATPQAGQSVYVTGLYMASCQDATGGATSNVNFTTTNLSGLEFAISQASAASACTGSPGLIQFSTPLKAAAAGTAVTLVSPTAATHTGYSTEIIWYSAP